MSRAGFVVGCLVIGGEPGQVVSYYLALGGYDNDTVIIPQVPAGGFIVARRQRQVA